MSDLKAQLVLTAKADGLKKGIKGSVKDLKGLAKNSAITSKKIKTIDKSSAKSAKSIKGFAKNTKLAGRALVDVVRDVGGFVRKEAALGRAVGNTTRMLKAQTKQTKRLAAAQKNTNRKQLATRGVAGTAAAYGGVGKKGGIIAGGGKRLLAGAMAFGAVSGAKRTYDAIIGSVREIDVGKGDLKSLGMKDVSYVGAEGKKLQAEYAGMYAADFVKAAYDIKSGLEKLTEKGVADVTAAAAITAKATKGDMANMTSLFATSHGMFKNQYAEMSDGEWANMFASIIATAVKKNKTDGSKMQVAIESAGDGVLKLGMDMTEMIAVLGLLQKTKTGGVAGTMLKSYGSNVAKAEANFTKMAAKGKNKTSVKLLNDDGKLLKIEQVIENIKKRYGADIDGREMEEIKTAFGSEEAVSFITAFLDMASEITKQAKELDAAGIGGLSVATEMAKAPDVDSYDAALKLKDQKRDLMMIEAAEVSRKDLLAEYKATGDQYLDAANKIKDTGAAFTNFESLKLMASAKWRDETGVAQLAAGEAVDATAGGLFDRFIEWTIDVKKQQANDNELRGAAPELPSMPAYEYKPENISKLDYARAAFEAFDLSGSMVNKVSNAYSAEDIDVDHLDILVQKMAAAIPADKITALLEQFTVQAADRYRDDMQAQEFDQSQDNRTFTKEINVQNHITVKVNSDASPKAIGQAVGIHAAAAVRRGEALADEDF